MKSKASFKGHPLHPILVSFPVAFFTGTLLFDILGLFYPESGFWITGSYLEIAGIISGLIAAVPGITDYFFTVPPDSSAKSRASKHGLINILLLVIFTASFTFRAKAASPVIVALEAAGVILLGIAGWLGGTLVHRNQIGTDLRYAGAGKWKEEYFKETSGELIVATAGELKTDQMKLLHIGNKRIVRGRSEKEYIAFDDRCTHRGGSLAGGVMICKTVQCPWHGSQFNAENGSVKAGPASEKIAVYSVSEKEGKVYIYL